MNDDSNSAASVQLDDDLILPEGYNPEMDFFSEDSYSAGESSPDPAPTPEQSPETAPTPEPENTDQASQAPTPEPDGQDAGNPAPPDSAPTTGLDQTAPDPQAQGQPHLLRFTARVDRNDVPVEVDEKELPTLYQKAQALDRAQNRMRALEDRTRRAEELSRTLGYDGLDDMLGSAEKRFRETEAQRLVAQGVNEEVAAAVAEQKLLAGRLRTPAPQTAPQAAPPEPGAPQPQDGRRDFRGEVEELRAIRPDAIKGQIPDGVLSAVSKGARLTDAYLSWESGQRQAELEKLRRENATLRQNAENAKRAPVTPAAAGGAPAPTPADDFLKGFWSD